MKQTGCLLEPETRIFRAVEFPAGNSKGSEQEQCEIVR